MAAYITSSYNFNVSPILNYSIYVANDININ